MAALHFVQYTCDEDALEAQRALVRSAGEGLYVDREWGPSQRGLRNALYNDPRRVPVGQPPLDCVAWRRLCVPSAVLGCAPGLLFDAAKAESTRRVVEQGSLSNRWFVEAMSACSAAVDALFVGWSRDTRRCEDQERGIYTLKFWKDGAWRYVHIDDQIPCRFDGKPLYSRAAASRHGDGGCPAWPLLLEKAYAKLHGSYENLGSIVGVAMEDGVLDLTAAAPMRLVRGEPWWEFLAKEGKLWAMLRQAVASDAGADRTSVAGAVGCAIRVAELAAEDAAPNGEGLLPESIYAVARTFEPVRGDTPKLVEMHNLSAALGAVAAWSGKWSEGDAAWRTMSAAVREDMRKLHIASAREKQADDEDDTKKAAGEKEADVVASVSAPPPAAPVAGASAGGGPAPMWMSFDDWSARFTSLLICPGTLRSGWKGKRWESEWKSLPRVEQSDEPELVASEAAKVADKDAAASTKEGGTTDADNAATFVAAAAPVKATRVVRDKAGGCPNFTESWALNPQFVFDVHPDNMSADPTAPTRVVISLAQRDRRWSAALQRSEHGLAFAATTTVEKKKSSSMLHLGFAVMQLNGKKGEVACKEWIQSKCVGMTPLWELRRSVACQLDLFPGRYAVVPSTFLPDRAATFWLEVRYSSGVRVKWRGKAEMTGEMLVDGPPEVARPTLDSDPEEPAEDAAKVSATKDEEDEAVPAEGKVEASAADGSESGSNSGSESGDEDSVVVDDDADAATAVGEGEGVAELDLDAIAASSDSNSSSDSNDNDDGDSSASKSAPSSPSSPSQRSPLSSPSRGADTTLEEESSEDEYAREEREARERAEAKKKKEAAEAAAIIAARSQFAADIIPGFIAPEGQCVAADALPRRGETTDNPTTDENRGLTYMQESIHELHMQMLSLKRDVAGLEAEVRVLDR